ncbi:hypothetical protein ECG_08316 [Echinococcus granulosus]|uniref:RAD51_interact domain-containing protein n=1 Tax=Echinococcus granulosus TaxID=6210 RepID=A0A068WW53_ECHGR|nr:hypothetical protein ECG_08316 [Echinococcus granulosus]CDS24080.1 hypothetical protein EgrG_000379100 [Echinococcus granulosus]
MSSPRKSSRNRSRVNYVKVLDCESDEDDFLIDGSGIPKSLKRKKCPSSYDEYTEAVSPSTSSLKSDNKTVSPAFATTKSRAGRCTNKSASNSTDVTPQPLTKKPLLSIPKLAPLSEIESGTKNMRQNLQADPPNNSMPSIEPSVQRNSTPSLVCVTSSSALRLGLSRKNIRKTLHPNVRLSH